MTRKRHVDYVRDYAQNLCPVIPHDATLSPTSTIAPGNRGKVPGQRKDDGTWVGGWKDMGDATMALAKLWDEMGADIGARTGFANRFALDVDLTVRKDAEHVLGIARGLYGRNLAVRRVDHPEHTKLLIYLELEGPMPASFNLDLVQSDGTHGQIQFLGPGRYFNMHGVHPRRLRPYVWENDPADKPLVKVSTVEFEAFWTAIGRDYEIAHRPRTSARNEIQREAEQCAQAELEALLDLIPNDESFAAYEPFVAMGAAIYGASGGADWGQAMWFAWCDQTDQAQPEKPEKLWASIGQARTGADRLRKFANERAPLEMARRAFEEPEIEPEVVQQAAVLMDDRQAFLEGWAFVNGELFYELPPWQPTTRSGFNARHVKAMKDGLRRALGGAKESTAAGLFALHSPNLVAATVHEPGQPRFVVQEGRRLLNMWTAPARPWRDKPIDLLVISFYRELAAFVLDAVEEADLWVQWHAWMLQNPDKAPGWGWIVRSGSGLGKDLILSPITTAHGTDHMPVSFRVFSTQFNSYAEKHLIVASEMRSKKGNGGEDVYTALKELMSGNRTNPIRRMHRDSYLARNVAGFIVYSNKDYPLQLDHDDRRFHVVEGLSAENRRSSEYYINARQFLETHEAMIGEYLHTLPLSADVCDLMTGNAPGSDAKARMLEQTADQLLHELFTDLVNGDPCSLLPIATTGEIKQWLKGYDLQPYETPNHLELPSLLYRLGARPLNPDRKNPKQPNPVEGRRLWRLVKTWRHKGIEYNLENMSLTRLAKLHEGQSMPPPDLKTVQEDEA